MIFKDKYC